MAMLLVWLGVISGAILGLSCDQAQAKAVLQLCLLVLLLSLL